VEHYYGLAAIAERIGVKTPKAVLHYYRDHGLPMFKRPDRVNKWRRVWYSNATLITVWELTRIQQGRKQYMTVEQRGGQKQS
jgi:hypothetical protein